MSLPSHSLKMLFSKLSWCVLPYKWKLSQLVRMGTVQHGGTTETTTINKTGRDGWLLCVPDEPQWAAERTGLPHTHDMSVSPFPYHPCQTCLGDSDGFQVTDIAKCGLKWCPVSARGSDCWARWDSGHRNFDCVHPMQLPGRCQAVRCSRTPLWGWGNTV